MCGDGHIYNVRMALVNRGRSDKGEKMKRLIIAFIMAVFTTTAYAETFTYIVPAGPDGGNAKWAQRVVKEWNKYLGNDKVVIRYMPGDPKKTFAKFNNELSKDGKTMIQSRGMIKYITSGDGWGGFNPKDYATIIAQHQGTFVFAKKDIPELPAIHIGGGSETIVDAMSIAMMLCGPMCFDKLVECSKSNMRQVKGWKGSGDRRKAFLNGEIDVTRDGFSHMIKTYKGGIKSGKTQVWYTHGVSLNGTIKPDPAMPEKWFNTIYKEKWGQVPSGRYYNAYAIILKTRSGLGKTVFLSKDSPHTDVLIKSFDTMLKNKASKKQLDKKLGKYPWALGKDANDSKMAIFGAINSKELLNDVKTSREVFGEKVTIKWSTFFN